MKKLLIIALALVMLLAMAGCCLSHEWVEADCETPKTCAKCEKTEGEALGHTWTDATCLEPKTCSVCGETEGEALGHTLSEATCTEAPVCSVCGVTEGEALGHAWVDATTEAPTTCSTCGETDGDPLSAVPTDLGMDHTTFVSTMNVVLATQGYELVFDEVDSDGMANYILKKTSTGDYMEVVAGFELAADGETAYSITVATPNISNSEDTTATGVVSGVAMALLNPDMAEQAVNDLVNTTPIESNGSNVYVVEFGGYLVMLIESADALGFYICPAA